MRAVSILPTRKIGAVCELLTDLGYHRDKRTRATRKKDLPTYRHFEKKDYRSYAPLIAEMYRDGSTLQVVTATLVIRSHFDNEQHNRTLRRLRDCFGGDFESDLGKNRYLKYDGVRRTPAESGCFLAYCTAGYNIGMAERYLSDRSFTPSPRDSGLGISEPAILSGNMLRVFLVSCLED